MQLLFACSLRNLQDCNNVAKKYVDPNLQHCPLSNCLVFLLSFPEVFITLMSFNSIMPSERHALHLNVGKYSELYSQRDTLLPCSAIDKYSISHPDSFLQQIVNAGKVKESETERGGQLRHKFSPGRRLGAEGRSLALRNILVLPGTPISSYSHTDTHSGPKYYTPSTFTSIATKFFPASLSPIFQS